ncbi:MAG: hypothetical protein K9I85_12640 [Saprospiraceae bacterium]|nr:hypothetical protein [Saprospiraceae bacterium]
MKLSIFFFLFAGMLVMLLSRCTKDHLPDPPICYQTDIEPLIVSNCTQSGCHNSVEKSAGYDFSTYEGILSAVEVGHYKKSSLYKVLIQPFGEKRMPQPPAEPFSDEQITLIARWIEEGAIQSLDCQSACDTTFVGYNGTITPILVNYCTGCHSGSQPQGDIDLSSWSKVKPYADNGSLAGSVRHASGYSAMPQNGSKLPECSIRQIEKWVADGAPNN